MSKNAKERDLDHLMEQNDTELTFLQSYGSYDDEVDPEALFLAIIRWFKSQGIQHNVTGAELTFEYGTLVKQKKGCELSFTAQNLPLVPSDVLIPGLVSGVMNEQRDTVSVVLTQWNASQRRFVERLFEFVQLVR